MKKIFLFFILLLALFGIENVKANVGNLCDLDKVVTENLIYEYSECNVVTINTLENIDKLSNFTDLTGLSFKNVNISDVSFINNYDIEELNFYGLKVNLDKLSSDSIKEISFQYVQIENDNFGAMANLPNLEYLIFNGYFNSIDSIKKLSQLENLVLVNIYNEGKIYDITPLYELKNIERLQIDEYYYTQDLINHLNKYNINYPEEYKNNIENIKKVNDFYDSLNLDNLTDIQKIITISNAINEQMHYAVEGVDDPKDTGFEYFLNGYGVCVNYAFMTEYFLNKAGFLAYVITGDGYETYNGYVNHAWNEVYYNGKWYAIDNTWTDGIVITESGIKNNEYPYFMVNPKDEIFLESVFHKTFVDLYNIIDYSFNISYESNWEEKLESDTVSIGKLFTPINPTRDGYEFAGWYTDNELKNAYNDEDYINRDLKLYAKWINVENKEETIEVDTDNNIENPKTGAFLNSSLICAGLVVAFIVFMKANKAKKFYKI